MAQSKRNHFIPKWLLRRFACADSKNREQIWLFRSTGEPFRTHINNVGSSNYFYGEPNNGLEEILAKIDDRDSRTLANIERGCDLALHADSICRMLRLLSIRTRSLREKFTDTATDLFRMLEESADSPESVPLMRAHIARIFDSEFEKIWEKVPQQVRMLMSKNEKRDLAFSKINDMDLQRAVAELFGTIRGKIPWNEAAERGHVNGLLNLLQQAEAEPVPAGWLTLVWQVIKMPSPKLVLGDCAVFAVRGEAPTILSAADAGKEPAGMCMPIAPDALLVGIVPGQSFPTDPAAINDASVSHSFDSFFASESTDMMLELMRRLGSSRGLLPQQTIQEIGLSAWRDLDKK